MVSGEAGELDRGWMVHSQESQVTVLLGSALLLIPAPFHQIPVTPFPS